MAARPSIRVLGLALLILGCASPAPRVENEIDAETPRLDALDDLIASVLAGHLISGREWGPRQPISSGEGPASCWSRTLQVDAQARRQDLFPRLEEGLREADFTDFTISPPEETPPGYFALLEVVAAPGLSCRFELLQEVKARMAVIIDDVGYSRSHRDLLLGTDLPLTLAVLPRLPYTAYWDRAGSGKGFEIILHCPLEAINLDLDLGPGGITEEMTAEEMEDILAVNLAELPHAVGCNNHMGSAFTADTEAMTVFLGLFPRHGLYFIDSLTVAGTATAAAARVAAVPVGRRDIFLDHVNEAEEINALFDRAVAVALRAGTALVIGHYRPLTLEILYRRLPELRQKGVQVVPASELVELP